MAITTLDGMVAGMQPPISFLKVGATMEAIGQRHTFFYVGGSPGAATANATGIGGAAITTNTGVPTTGHFPFINSNSTYLARMEATCSVTGRLTLCDRLWHNSGIVVTTTTAQTVTSAAWPARDADGATDGRGVMIALEVSTITGNAGATAPSISYYDSNNGGPYTASIAAFPITAAVGTFQPFALAAGSVGVRSVASVTLTTSLVSGAVHLVAYREIASVNIAVANVGAMQDAIALGFPRLYNNSSLFLVWQPTATTACTPMGSITYAQG